MSEGSYLCVPLLYFTVRSEACTPPLRRALGVVQKLNFNRAVYVKLKQISCCEINSVLQHNVSQIYCCLETYMFDICSLKALIFVCTHAKTLW